MRSNLFLIFISGFLCFCQSDGGKKISEQPPQKESLNLQSKKDLKGHTPYGVNSANFSPDGTKVVKVVGSRSHMTKETSAFVDIPELQAYLTTHT